MIHDATPWVRIYALCEYPNTPRYVGKTTQWLHERHKAHIRDARRTPHPQRPVLRWLRKQIASDAWLTIKLLENVSPGTDWASRESHWISRLRAEGANLLNLTAGGEGLSGHCFAGTAHAEKIAAALRTGGNFSCEVCGAVFWRKKNEVAAGHNRFCSRVCSNVRHKGRRLFA